MNSSDLSNIIRISSLFARTGSIGLAYIVSIRGVCQFDLNKVEEYLNLENKTHKKDNSAFNATKELKNYKNSLNDADKLLLTVCPKCQALLFPLYNCEIRTKKKSANRNQQAKFFLARCNYCHYNTKIGVGTTRKDRRLNKKMHTEKLKELSESSKKKDFKQRTPKTKKKRRSTISVESAKALGVLASTLKKKPLLAELPSEISNKKKTGCSLSDFFEALSH